jgi:hypothetical protein
VRALNAYEARLVNSAIAHCAALEQTGCAQVRRDLVAARETTARLMTQWREALGAEQHNDLGARTRGLVRHIKTLEAERVVHRERLHRLSNAEGLRAGQADISEWHHAYASGLRVASAIMGGYETHTIEQPAVWGRDRNTLRGRYRLSRARRSSVLGAMCEALGGWILNEPAVS